MRILIQRIHSMILRKTIISPFCFHFTGLQSLRKRSPSWNNELSLVDSVFNILTLINGLHNLSGCGMVKQRDCDEVDLAEIIKIMALENRFLPGTPENRSSWPIITEDNKRPLLIAMDAEWEQDETSGMTIPFQMTRSIRNDPWFIFSGSCRWPVQAPGSSY